MLSLTQAAKKLHVHPNTLRRWCEEGKVASQVSSSGERLIPEKDIMRHLCEAYKNISTCGCFFSFCQVKIS